MVGHQTPEKPMTLCCPHCRREISAKDIVALESWRDEDAEVVRDVVLVCPDCGKPLAPQASGAADSRSVPS
jgi:hypothetical protein